MSLQIRVAKRGKSAKDSTDPNDFIFHSAYNTFKIIEEGTASPTLSDTGGVEATGSIPHGKSYIPFVFAFCIFANGRGGAPGTKASNAEFWFTRLSVDATFIQVKYINDTGGNYTPTFKYFICEIPIS